MGSLVVTPVATNATVTLSSPAKLNWIAWDGSTGGATPNQSMSGGAGTITAVPISPAGFDGYNDTDNGRHINWTGGTPTGSGSTFEQGINENYLGTSGEQGSYYVEFPADTTSSEAVLYMGGYNTAIKIDVALSDSSATPFTDSTTINANGGNQQVAGTITVVYAANSAAQKVRITVTVISPTGDYGNVGLSAATYRRASASTSLTPGVASIALAGYAPTVARTANQALTPGAASIALAGYAPTVARTANQGVAPGVAALTLTGYAPSVTQSAGLTLTPGVGAIALTGYAPTVARTANQALVPGAATLSLTGYAPVVSVGSASPSLFPGTAVVGLTGYAPVVTQSGAGGVDTWGSVYVRKKKQPVKTVGGPPPGPTLRETIANLFEEPAVSAVAASIDDEDEEEVLLLFT